VGYFLRQEIITQSYRSATPKAEIRSATTTSALAEEKFDFSDYLWYIWMRKNLSGDLRFL